jgi:hypothetical protein
MPVERNARAIVDFLAKRAKVDGTSAAAPAWIGLIELRAGLGWGSEHGHAPTLSSLIRDLEVLKVVETRGGWELGERFEVRLLADGGKGGV